MQLVTEVEETFRLRRLAALLAVVSAVLGLVLLVWASNNWAELRPGDTETLRRLQASIVAALVAQEPHTIHLAEYNADAFSEVCIVHEYQDGYRSLSGRTPDFGLPPRGGPRTEDGQYALAFVRHGQAGFVFLPARRVSVMTGNECFPVASALVEVTPARPRSSTTLRLTGSTASR